MEEGDTGTGLDRAIVPGVLFQLYQDLCPPVHEPSRKQPAGQPRGKVLLSHPGTDGTEKFPLECYARQSEVLVTDDLAYVRDRVNGYFRKLLGQQDVWVLL